MPPTSFSVRQWLCIACEAWWIRKTHELLKKIGILPDLFENLEIFEILFCLLFICLSRLKFWQLFSWCGLPIPTHLYIVTLTQDSHNTRKFIPFSSRLVCWFFNVPQGTYDHKRYLWDGAYGLWSLSEKNWKSNHLRVSLQRQHFFLSYFKTPSAQKLPHSSPVLKQFSPRCAISGHHRI